MSPIGFSRQLISGDRAALAWKDKKGRSGYGTPAGCVTQGESLRGRWPENTFFPYTFNITRFLRSNPRATPADSYDQAHEKHDQEDIKQNFRDSSRRGCYTGKSQKCSDERNEQEHDCPIKHDASSPQNEGWQIP